MPGNRGQWIECIGKEIIMPTKLLRRCGYRSPEDLVDFIMTGVAIAPMVVFLGCGFDEAFSVMLFMLLATIAVIPWLHVRSEAKRRDEEARAEAQAAYLRQITGKD